jgi:hypothetical protein
MPRFIVRVGYDWIVHASRDVEVDAPDAGTAERTALQMSTEERDFWAEGIECDGEAGATEVTSVEAEYEDDAPCEPPHAGSSLERHGNG